MPCMKYSGVKLSTVKYLLKVIFFKKNLSRNTIDFRYYAFKMSIYCSYRNVPSIIFPLIPVKFDLYCHIIRLKRFTSTLNDIYYWLKFSTVQHQCYSSISTEFKSCITHSRRTVQEIMMSLDGIHAPESLVLPGTIGGSSWGASPGVSHFGGATRLRASSQKVENEKWSRLKLHRVRILLISQWGCYHQHNWQPIHRSQSVSISTPKIIMSNKITASNHSVHSSENDW